MVNAYVKDPREIAKPGDVVRVYAIGMITNRLYLSGAHVNYG
jgi:exosome complex RNA-binding protein Csl4